MELCITGGRVLLGDDFAAATVHVDADGRIAEVGSSAAGAAALDASGLTVLPGIVDIHGDAFERQMMPRPGVNFALDVAIADTDRQVIANGITTVFHSVTWSWEPGLRGADNARTMLETMEALRPRLSADTRCQLRYETFNFEAEAEVCDWLAARRIDALAFNDHLPPPASMARPEKLAQMIDRSGLDRERFLALVEGLRARGDEVPDSIARIAKRALAAGVPLLSHDDETIEQRRWFRALGCRVCEFPTNVETAQEAAASGDDIVFGAPNIVRGGSHLGWVKASDMVADGLCSILASDYFYPAPTLAAFRLAQDGTVTLPRAWALISENPARAMKLADRGRIAPGLRADIILLDASVPGRPRVVGALVDGAIVYLTEPSRLAGVSKSRSSARSAPVEA